MCGTDTLYCLIGITIYWCGSSENCRNNPVFYQMSVIVMWLSNQSPEYHIIKGTFDQLQYLTDHGQVFVQVLCSFFEIFKFRFISVLMKDVIVSF